MGPDWDALPSNTVTLTALCHLLRQDRTITWPIEEFLTQAAGGLEVDIERLSQEFFTVAARSSFVSPKERRGELK
jgi:hypothetical protein